MPCRGVILAIRRLNFVDLGGFREDLNVGEDTLLVELASRRWPGQVVFDPQMRVLHRGRSTLGSYWRHQERFGYHRGKLGLRLKAGFRGERPTRPLRDLLMHAPFRLLFNPNHSMGTS